MNQSRTGAVRYEPVQDGNWSVRYGTELVCNGAFPPVCAGRFGMQRCGTGRVKPAKSGRDPDRAVLSRTYLTVLLRWVTETSERVPTSSSYTRHPLIGRQNQHFCATGIITNNHSTHEVFLANGESFVY